jgi:peptidoglycan hydrolase-like protein with peptidoglycan-binding domain
MVVAQRVSNHAVEGGMRLGETDRLGPVYIRWVQEALNRVAGAGLKVDGRLGPLTRGAVKAFQRGRGLVADGVVGRRTEAALVAAGAPKPPAVSSTRPGASPKKACPALAGGPPYADVVVPLPTPGPGYYSYHKPPKNQFGLAETIRALQAIGAAWFRAHPSGPRIGIGDISRYGGGKLPPHASHQCGVDVDILPIRNDGREARVTYHDAVYSRELTQELVRAIRANGVLRVQYIFFNDRAVTGVSEESGHDNHLHVRFFPPGKVSERETDREEAQGKIDRRSPAYVRWVQESLNRVSGAGLTVDGRFGPRTRGAVQAFQGRHGLAADGVVGPRTEAALVAAGAPRPPGALSGGTTPAVLCSPPDLPPPQRTAVAVTSYFETGVPFGCAVSRTDGISMGMLQWNLLAGTLQTMLESFERQTRRLREFFGADTERVRQLTALRHTAEERRQAVAEAGAEGLADRWRTPLLRLCADADFCALLMRDVNSRMVRARTVARQVGLGSVRGLAMCFDVNVGDGLSDAKARRFVARIAGREAALGRSLSEREKLVEIANEAADRVTKWQAERRARRLVLANGTGRYRGGNWDLDRIFPTLDERWE